MKKLFGAIFTLLIGISLVACGKKFDFKTEYKNEIKVGEETKVVVKDKDDKELVGATIKLTIKSGNDNISVNSNIIKGLKTGDAKVTVHVTLKEETAKKDITIKVIEGDSLGNVGLPEAKLGHYMRDADIIQEDGNRYLVYVTNSETAEEDNVIAIRKGVVSGDDYLYGEEKIIIKPSAEGWDKYIGSASIVKGDFKFEGTDYKYLIAYEGTTKENNNARSIGFAVSNDILGTWKKIGNAPIVEYDAEVYGESYRGFYAPSLINMDKESNIRLFYTWADAYGHFTYFVDIDAKDLGNLTISGYAMVTNHGNLSTGEDVTMMPNADFVYDPVNKDVYMIKDYSPTPSQDPQVSTQIELALIKEEELYTATNKTGWESLSLYDMFDTEDQAYERLYSGTLISDEYGHVINKDRLEIVYNVSDLNADNPDHIFSQRFFSFTFSK